MHLVLGTKWDELDLKMGVGAPWSDPGTIHLRMNEAPLQPFLPKLLSIDKFIWTLIEINGNINVRNAKSNRDGMWLLKDFFLKKDGIGIPLMFLAMSPSIKCNRTANKT